MRNVAWDFHYYGGETNGSKDPAVLANAIQAHVTASQAVRSGDGLVPVVIGEYGPSTTGSGSYDANGLQVVQAVDNSGYGTLAWAWSAGTDTLVNSSGLTDFGQLVAKHIAAGAPTPATPVAPTTNPAPANPAPTNANPMNPAPTTPNPANGGGGTSPAPVGTGADTLVLTLSEDAYGGDARFQLTVDGKAVGPVQSVTALHSQGQTEGFTFKGDWSGAHRFGVTFTNDAWGGSAGVDRNLYVEGAVFDGTMVEGAAALYGNGTVTFGTPPGQASSSQAGAASQAGTVPASTGSSGSTTPADTLSVTDNDGSSAAVPLIVSGSHTDHPTSTSTVQQVAGSGTDTLTTSGSVKAEAATLGDGTRKLVLVNPRSMVLTGGSGADTVTADGGANEFVAGTGSLDVTGGPDAASYVLHAGSGPLTVEDFDPAKGDTLSVDKALQGALAQAPDGHGGTLLTFGAKQGSIDLINHASVSPSAIRFI